MEEELVALREKKLRDLMTAVNDGKNKADWPGTPVEVTDSNFDSITQKYEALVIDCWAPWCGPCRMIGPTVEALAKDYKGKVAFGKLNTDDNIGIANKFGIMSIPTLLFFKKGKLVDKSIGANPRQMIEEHVKKLL